MVLRSDVLHSALALVVVLLALAGVYAGLGAYFIAAIQVAVYAGAVMVLFLFAIMVLKSRREVAGPSGRLVGVGATVVGGALLLALGGAAEWGARRFNAADLHTGAPGLSEFARLLFGEYLLGFELVGLLLLVTLVAVVVLAGKAPGGEEG